MSPEMRGQRGQSPHSLIQAFPAAEYRNRKVLLIVPDGTRTAPIGLICRTLHDQVGGVTKSFDVLIALGTHQPMSEAAIRQRLEISEDERHGVYRNVRFFNHEWNNPEALQRIGVIPSEEIHELAICRLRAFHSFCKHCTTDCMNWDT